MRGRDEAFTHSFCIHYPDRLYTAFKCSAGLAAFGAGLAYVCARLAALCAGLCKAHAIYELAA
jgi:hypothetical protein